MQEIKKLFLKSCSVFLLFSQSICSSFKQEKPPSVLASKTYEHSLCNNTYSAFFLVPQEEAVTASLENHIHDSLKKSSFNKNFSSFIKAYNEKKFPMEEVIPKDLLSGNDNRHLVKQGVYDKVPFGLCNDDFYRTYCFFYDRAAYVVSDIYNSTSTYRNLIEQTFPWENRIDFMEIVEKLCEKELFDASIFFFYQAIIHAPSKENALQCMGNYKSYLISDKRKEKVKLWIDGRIAQRISDTGKADGIQDLILRITGWILFSEKNKGTPVENIEKEYKNMIFPLIEQ